MRTLRIRPASDGHDERRRHGRRGGRGERGASLVEYVILVGLIAVVVLISVRVLGTATSSRWSDTNSQIETW